jgi:hypothetical protein
MRWFPALLRTLLIVLAITAATGVSPAGAAQDGVTKEIFKITCASDPGDVQGPADVVPEGCERAEGVTFTVTTPDGTDLDSCTTNADGRCFVTLPFDPRTVDPTDPILIHEDVATLPPGVVPRENPLESIVGATDLNANLFVNLAETDGEPTPEPTAEPPKELPETGAGPGAPGRGGAAWLLLAAAGFAGVGLVALRQRWGHRQHP